MKKTIATLLFTLMIMLPNTFSQPTSDQLRNGFFGMKDEDCGQQKFFQFIKSDEYLSPVHQAYAGTAEAATAECVRGPSGKIGHFNRGKRNIEEAVERAPENAEVRFMRFATQTNIPGFLFYDNIKEDKALIIEQLPTLLTNPDERDFWIRVAGFLIDSGELEKEEENKISKVIEKKQ
jgi:hypothetical protein